MRKNAKVLALLMAFVVVFAMGLSAERARNRMTDRIRS